ncbi:MAG: 7-cyano-7-deazaguanine synthase [Acidobacteriota bacterium]
MTDVAVLFSAGLDSAVLLAHAARQAPGDARVQPIYVSAGLAWEGEERAMADRLLRSGAYAPTILPLVTLQVDMRDVYPASHWAVRGEAPAFDTPDEDVYLEGRNIVLLSKTAVYMARTKVSRVMIGPLAGNPFPDATTAFFEAMATALSAGLAFPIRIDAPFASMHKADVVRLGRSLGVPLELTLSCMQAVDGRHCGRCSKCRERMDGFREAGVTDPTPYAATG